MRDILADEELLFDYAFCETYANEAFECACGSANCRNHIKSDDWKRAEIMEKYKNYYSPYLRDKVTTLSGSR
jgi:hypothetical protein